MFFGDIGQRLRRLRRDLACEALRKDTLRQAEVENLGVSPLGDENVGGFDVAMNDAFAVSGIERIGNLDGNRDNALRIQGACGDQVFQRHAIQVLHGDERLAFVAPDFVDGADIGVIERRCASCFAAKTFQGMRVPGCVLRQKL